MPIEINFSDLTSGNGPGKAGETPGPGGEGSAGGEGNFLLQLNEVLRNVKTNIDAFKESLEIIRELRGQQPGEIHRLPPGKVYTGPGPQDPPPGPAPALPVITALQAQFGDITIAELIQTLLKQYGGLTLSQLTELLKGQ